MNIRKLGTRKNSNFFFGWRGPLVMIFGGVGQEGHVGWGQGGWQGAKWGQGSGSHMAGVGGEYRGGRDGKGQKGKMAVAGLVGVGGGWWPGGRG